MTSARLISTAIPVVLGLVATTHLPAVEVGGWVAAEGTLFAERGIDDQRQLSGSLAAQPELYYAFDDGVWSITFEPFARIDASDEERTHFDLREASALAVFASYEIKIGISREFWGATEFNHLVDIINQTDLVEDIDAEDKLGQPMIKGTWFGNWGQLDVFVLPGFRERTFPGVDGRLRTPIVIDADAARYESGAEQGHVDLAARVSTTFGPIDLGVGIFHGTDRDPQLLFDPSGQRLIPYYQQITQASLDATAAAGQTLWKLEALVRDSDRETYTAATAGIEYTVVGLFDSRSDLGLLLEYSWDQRGDDSPSLLQNDVALGLRWAANDFADSELLLGLVIDSAGGGQFLTTEYNRRLTDHLELDVQLRAIANSADDPALASLRHDHHLRATLSYHF